MVDHLPRQRMLRKKERLAAIAAFFTPGDRAVWYAVGAIALLATTIVDWSAK